MNGEIDGIEFEWEAGDAYTNQSFRVKGIGRLNTEEMVDLVGDDALTDWLYDARDAEYNDRMAYREWASQRL